MRRWILIATVLILTIGGVGLVWSALQEPGTQRFEADVIGEVEFELPALGFARVEGDYDWQFPRDFGPHPDFQREQWQLQTIGDCETAFDIRFDRFSILADSIRLTRDSAWAFRAAYTVDLTVNDLYEQRVSRASLGLAGADANHVWLDDWRLNWQTGRLFATIEDLMLDVEFALENDPPSTGIVDNWYSYTRFGRTQDGCEVSLTHRFTTQS